jgi:hypothetical protein
MYYDNSDFTGAQVFTGIRFTYAASGVVNLSYRGGSSWVTTGLTSTSFNQGTIYTIEIIGNNKASGTINYTYNGDAQTVATDKLDLYINGVLVGNDISKAQMANNTNIVSTVFNGISSTSNAANIFVDDVVVYNAVPAVIGGGSSKVSIPTFSPEAGTYYSDQNVTISTETDGATIRYTTNGNDPDETSTVFTTPIAVSATTTIKAKAFKTDMDPSDVASATYTIVKTPNITVEESPIPDMSAYVDASDSEIITVNGVNLTADITLALGGADAAQFRLSTSTLAQTDGSVTDASVTIYYEPKATGSHTATLTLSSDGAADVTRTLKGAVIEPITVPNVIITEVYGGGGNSGATYTHDFVELYNTTESSVEIGGWSVQYYSSAGTAPGTGPTYNMIIIPDGKYIPALGHFLIKAASGGANGVDLPTADVSGPDASGNNFNAAAGAGKVILFTTNTAQTISDINSVVNNANFKDYVPYGSSTLPVPVWGSSMTSNASATTSASRKIVSNVYVYTQNIGNDFEVVTPNPENSGLSTATNEAKLTNLIYAHNAKIHFAATAGEKVEVYNAVGQKIISTLSTDGQNELSVNAKGVMIVKVGSRLAKVIL